MALPKGDFSRLLRELRSAGPLDRVRLLGRSLAALRSLSPWDRKVLLRMAGFEGAETLVERLAGENRETAEALQRVLADLEEHPGQLEATVRKLGDPKRRAEAVDELLATLDRAVAAPEAEPDDEPAEAGPAARESRAVPGDAAAPTPPPVGPGPWKDPMEAPAGPTAEAPLREAVPPPPPAPVDPRPSTRRAPTPPAPTPPAIAEPPEPPAPPPPAIEVIVTDEEPAVEVETKPPPTPEPPSPVPESSAWDLAAEAQAAVSPEPVAPLEPALPDEAPSAVGALEGLLDLRRRLDAGEDVDASELRRLMDRELPFPWARRRAIQGWLAAGAGTDLEEALALIDTLPPGPDRAWCLATLATARPWSAADWRRIVDSAPGPAARRHLELRRRRS